MYITNKNHTSKIRNYEIEDIIEVLSEKCSCGDYNKLIRARGRISDVIKLSNKEIDMFEIQEAIYSLNDVPFWEVHVENENVEIRMEYNIDKIINKSELERELKDKLELLSAKVHIFKEGELVDRGKIFKYPISRKPTYIYNTREKRLNQNLNMENKNFKIKIIIGRNYALKI